MSQNNELNPAYLFIIVVAFIFGGAMLLDFLDDTPKPCEVYVQKYLEEDVQMFAKVNNDYKDETAENSRQIILEFPDYYSKKANVAIMNYISNVNGKLDSVNGVANMHNTINPMLVGVPGSGIGVGATTGVSVSSKSQYIITVPNGAKFSDDLQNRIDRYFKYYDYVEIFLEKENRS